MWGRGLIVTNSSSSSIALMRNAALQRVGNYFERQGCPTIIGGDIRGNYEEIPVTTDFVISEIHPVFLARPWGHKRNHCLRRRIVVLVMINTTDSFIHGENFCFNTFQCFVTDLNSRFFDKRFNIT